MVKSALFALAMIVLGLGFLAAVTKPKAMPPPPNVAEQSLKGDRIRAAFMGLPDPDPLTATPIRVIPISRQGPSDTPTTPAVLTRIATALPSPPDEPEGPRGAVNTPETAIKEVVPDEPNEPTIAASPRHHSGGGADICAAHGMRRLEVRHGWRCVHARR